MVNPARLVIAAAGSGHGKTTVATGLLAAFRAAGVKAAGFKVGPDYIDPSYHALACGRPGRNLDPVLVGEDLIAPLFLHGSAGAQVSIVEGVMGLYDGRDGDFGSTAHVARLLEAPIVMVVDAAGHGRSVAALLHGFRDFGPAAIAGVILNRVGSARHEELLRSACTEVGVPVLGVLRRAEQVAVPSRHLGLIPAAERTAAATAAVQAMSGLLSVDLEAVLALARSAPPIAAKPWSFDRRDRRAVIAVAGGAAFTFGYREQIELLEAAGAEVVTFDPLHDETLPPGTAGLVVGGGFPEVYVVELAANVKLARQVRALSARAPVAAECAGLLWLARSLDDKPMCGVLDAEATMTDRLTLGYRDAQAAGDNVLTVKGTLVKGHEFHRTIVTPRRGGQAAWRMNAADEGFVQGRLIASYLHTHWAARPEFATRFLEAACA